MAKDLLYGFVHFNGDYLDGVFRPTLVDIIANLHRKSVVCIDTDSNVSSVDRETSYLVNNFQFQDIIKGKGEKVTEIGIPMLIAQIYIACVEKSLWNYAKAIGVEDKLIPLIELELEHFMEYLQLTNAKKQYVVVRTVSDMHPVDRYCNVTGLVYTKTGANPEIASAAEDIVINDIMTPIKDTNHKRVVEKCKQATRNSISDLQDPKYITDKRTILKIASEDIALKDMRRKAVEFWNMVYGERYGEIELPGIFGIIPIEFTKDILERYITKYPDEYTKMCQFVETLYKWKQCFRARALATTYFATEEEDGEDDINKSYLTKVNIVNMDIYSTFLDHFNRIQKQIVKEDIVNWNPKLYGIITNEIDSAGAEYKEFLTKVWGIPKTPFNPNKEIMKLDRLAVPANLIEVPESIQENGYDIIDIESATALEGYVAPMAHSLSIVCPRNKKYTNVVSSVLEVF